MRAVFLTVSLFWAASPALACRPMEGEVYDEIPSKRLVVAVAQVTDMTITKSSEAASCFAVSYHTVEVLVGAIKNEFRVETCAQEGPITEADLAGTPDPYGFSKGATVLVGVIQSRPDSSDLRYAVPDCWGPYHLRLDEMGDIEREALIADLKRMLVE